MTNSQITAEMEPKPRRNRKPVDIIRRSHATTKGVRHPDANLIRLGKMFLECWQEGADLVAQINGTLARLVEENPAPEILREGIAKHLNELRRPHDLMEAKWIVIYGQIPGAFGRDADANDLALGASTSYTTILEAAAERAGIPAMVAKYTEIRAMEIATLAAIIEAEAKTATGIAIKLRALDYHHHWTHREKRYEEFAPVPQLVAALADAERLAMEAAQ